MISSFQSSPLNHADMPATVAEMMSQPLGGAELRLRLIGKQGWGLYRPPFSYDMRFEETGSLWGRNNYGTEDTGQWVIADNGEMTVSWRSYWDAHTTRVYADGEVLHMFDTGTGNWRTSMIIPVE